MWHFQKIAQTIWVGVLGGAIGLADQWQKKGVFRKPV